jgi:hypothetical protein
MGRYGNRLHIFKAIKLPKEYSLPLSETAFDCGFYIPPIRPESPPKGGSWHSFEWFLYHSQKGSARKESFSWVSKKPTHWPTNWLDTIIRLAIIGGINFPSMKISKP